MSAQGPVAVVGAGAFGTALAVAWARAGRDVMLWGRGLPEGARQSPRLPGTPFPEGLRAVGAEALRDAAILVIAIPTQRLAEALAALPLPDAPAVAACKGIDLGTLTGPTGILRAAGLRRAHVLTGPSFAADIAAGLPTALTLAGPEAEALQGALSTPALRLYASADAAGAELGGALKNVTAIGCGACIGAGLGESARAALLTRGHAEAVRLAAALGADPQTLAGLSGLGDLCLTATSEGSRNYRYGLSLGRGEAFDGAVTVEGAATAPAAVRLGARHGIEMPVAHAVTGLVSGDLDIEGAMSSLLSRPLTTE